MASVTRMEGKTGVSYRITVSLGRDRNGKQVLKRTTFRPTKKSFAAQEKEAQQFAGKYEERLAKGEIGTGKNKRFRDTVSEWYDVWAVDNLTRSVREGYLDIIERRIMDEIGDFKLSAITTEMLQKIFTDMKNKGYAVKTIHRTYTAVNSVFRWAKKQKRIATNPCIDCDLPSLKVERMENAATPELKCFNEEQAVRFLDCLSWEYPFEFGKRTRKDSKGEKYEIAGYTRYYTLPLVYQVFFTIAIYSGFRRGEILPLRWTDINFDEETITIRKGVAKVSHAVIEKSPKTASGYREIILPERCFSILRKWQLEQMKLILSSRSDESNWNRKTPEKNYIFTQENGSMMYPDTPSFMFKKLIERYNKLITSRIENGEAAGAELLPDITLHDLRHTSATLLISSGIDPVTVAARLGHADTRTTLNVYSHVLKKVDRTASEKLGEMLG